MFFFFLMVALFIGGYAVIAMEHPLKVDKAGTALLLGMLLWTTFVVGRVDILSLNASGAYREYLETTGNAGTPTDMLIFITHSSVMEHLAEISAILFFLLGAMTIVETIDQHQGFKLLTDKIKTTNRLNLLWVLSTLTFFMSAVLDNLTTTIVMVTLLRQLIKDNQTRWFFAGMIVIAANAGGAWSPIGDVTTIMLWIGGQITAGNIIKGVFLPSLFSLIVPLIVVSFTMKGTVTRTESVAESKNFTSNFERKLVLIMGIAGLIFVPIFKTLTHLPPYMGMLIALGVLWVTTELLHKGKPLVDKRKLTVVGTLKNIDIPTIFFFLGILTAVAALQSAGHLSFLATWLNDHVGNIYAINLIIGVLSSVVDNVPLVAGAMGMYEIAPAGAMGYSAFFIQDGPFWEFLSYCAGTGGSILIIGSAAGVAAMGMEKIDFIWYFKKISLLALIGYLAGAGVFFLQAM